MKIEDYINIISSTNLFCGFPRDELLKIFSSSDCEIRKYEKEQIIHFQNELCHTMDIILKGRVTVQNIDKNGNVLTINVFTDRDSIGTNLVFSSKNYYPMTTMAASRVTMLHIKRELVLEICKNNTGFMSKLMQEISDRSIVLTDKITAISLKSIRQYIIDFLKYEYYVQNSHVIKLNISKKDLAERWGIQRSSLSRELNKMRNDGLIEYNARTITIKSELIKEYFN